MRILFISSTRVGDAILSTGLLDHLIRENPGAKVTVACGPAAASLFEAVPNLERVIVLDKMVYSLHWVWLWSQCMGRFWDVLVDLRNSPMGFVLPAKKRYRMVRSKEEIHRVPFLAMTLGLRENPPPPKLWMAEKHEKLAADLIPDGPPVIAVGPTANWKAKSWRPEHFADLLERLTGGNGIVPGGRVAIFGRDDERPMALRLIDAIPAERRIDLVGRLDLLDAFACIGRCAFYVGNDSGLMHLAAASGIPTLGLFGPSKEALYRPWGDNSHYVRTPESFADIFPPNFDHRTSDSLMDSLTVDMAENAARELWERMR